MKELVDLLRKEAKMNKITLAELADAIGVSERALYGKLKRGKLTVNEVSKLAGKIGYKLVLVKDKIEL